MQGFHAARGCSYFILVSVSPEQRSPTCPLSVLTLMIVGRILTPLLSIISLSHISLMSKGSCVMSLPNCVVTIGLSARERSAMDLTGLFNLAFEPFVEDCDCLAVASDC